MSCAVVDELNLAPRWLAQARLADQVTLRRSGVLIKPDSGGR
jgi:hypothetical protein